MLATVALLLCGGAQAQSGVRVWAVGDSFRIDPTNGKAFEANALVFPDSPGGNYRESNLLWDGARKRISLKAARNEIVSFQLIVERTDGRAALGRRCQSRRFDRPGATLPKDSVELFKEWYVNITRRSAQDYSLGTGWYPDALIPCTHWTGKLFPKSYILPFDVPDLLNNIGPDQRNQAVWVDVYVPRGSQAGARWEPTNRRSRCRRMRAIAWNCR